MQSVSLRDEVAERVGPFHLSDPSHVEPLFAIHLVSPLGALTKLIPREEAGWRKRGHGLAGRLQPRVGQQVTQPLERIMEPCNEPFADVRKMVSKSP